MTTNPTLRHPRRLPALGVLLLGMLLAVLTWMAVARADQQALEQEHGRRFSQIAYEVESRTIQARNVLRGLQGLFIASDDVSRMDFHQYARALEIEEGTLGLQAVQFARLVGDAQRPAFEARVRADTTLEPGGYPRFSVQPEGTRTYYVPTLYNEPMRGNEAAFGYDTAFGAVRMAVLAAARDSGQTRASAPFKLVQSSRMGVALRAPVYRNSEPTQTLQQRRDAYLGQVSVVFIVDNLLGAALGNHFGVDTQVTLTDMGSIADGTPPPEADSLLGRYGELPADSVWRTPLDAAQTLIVAGRFWQIRMQSLPVNPLLQVKALTAGALVLALTLLTLLFAGRVLSQRDTAQALASGLRETLDQSEARAAALLEATLTGIITLDSTDRIRSANPAAAALFGYPEAQLEGKAFAQLVPGLRPDDLRPGTTQDVTVVTRDMRSLPVAMSLGQVRYGSEFLLLASFHDMTAQKRLEEQQRAFARAMDDTVRERTAELTRVNRELEAFAYSVAHDLRAPARHVHGYARVIEQRHASQLDAIALNYLGRIQRASADMGRLIDGMLAFAQLGNHAMLPTDVDLGALVQRTQALLEPELEGRNVQWRVGPMPTVRADQSLMAQVMANLLGNAVKYSARSDPAVIEVFADTSVAGEHRICVADNGIGIDMRHASRLFQVFSRLHHADEFDGTGIGLATVQRILDRHGGRVWVESEPGHGARFWFALPA